MYRLAIELGLTDGPSLPFIDHDPTMDLPPAPPAFPVKELERKIASATQDERTFFCDFLREHQYRKKPEQVFLSSETPYKYFVDNGLLEIVWSRRMLLPATREELKDILSAHGVSFKKNDSKPVLQGLCEELPPPVFEALSADYVSLRLSPRFRKGIRRIYSALLAEDKELYPEKHINYWIIDEEDGSGGE